MSVDLYPDDHKDDPRFAKKELLEKLPAFNDSYQTWYSQALALIKVILPDRANDFIEYYKLAKPPKELNHSTYTISDYLKGMSASYSGRQIVGPKAAVTVLEQQVQIVKAAEARFESSLFDIAALVQADLFDNELEVAGELNEKGFGRGAGAVAGVVLEGHLASVCKNHSVKLAKKKPTLFDFYEALKSADIIDVKTWRFIQHLADIRNSCSHKGPKEPTKEDVLDLIVGVRKISKTVL